MRTLALHPTDPEWLAVGIELGGVMRSRDARETWIEHNPEAHTDAHQLLTHPLAHECLYDAAESWSRLPVGLPDLIDLAATTA